MRLKETTMQHTLRAISLGLTAIVLMAASASATPAIPSFAVLLPRGHVSENNRTYTSEALVKALRARGFIADVISDPAGDAAILGPAMCASAGVNVLLGSTVAIEIQPDREINQWATAKIDLSGFDCTKGRTLGASSGSAGNYNWNWAVDQAVADALKHLPHD
jgi:hypothetical protein